MARSIDQHEVDESTLHVRGDELDADPLTHFELGHSGHELSFDRGREDANPCVAHRAAGHDRVELLAHVRFEEQGGLGLADAALDLLCGIFLLGAAVDGTGIRLAIQPKRDLDPVSASDRTSGT